MNKQFQRIGFLFLIILIISMACDLVSSKTIQTPGLPETLAARTWSVIQTNAYLAITPTNTNPSPTNTPTMTNTSTITLTPSPTKTPIPPLTMRPTNTPQPTTNTPIPSITPAPTDYYYPGGGGGGGGSGNGNGKTCLAARLISHITIPDDEILPPSLHFTKIWRIQNVGSCTWDTSVKMVFVSGDSMDGESTRIPSKVRPGKTVDVAVDMVSPDDDGSHTGNWKLKYQSQKFGDGRNPFSVEINVEDNPQGTIYNFATHYCSADWWSSKSQHLHCPGKVGSSIGFVVRVDTPHMENGNYSKPGIWTHPPLVNGGEIGGIFPALIIQSGDRFMAELACLYDYPECDVTFDLYYQVDGDSDTILLGHWEEEYDGATTPVDIDLSFLDSHYAAFIFQVTGHGSQSEDNAAFWFNPRIYHP